MKTGSSVFVFQVAEPWFPPSRIRHKLAKNFFHCSLTDPNRVFPSVPIPMKRFKIEELAVSYGAYSAKQNPVCEDSLGRIKYQDRFVDPSSDSDEGCNVEVDASAFCC